MKDNLHQKITLSGRGILSEEYVNEREKEYFLTIYVYMGMDYRINNCCDTGNSFSKETEIKTRISEKCYNHLKEQIKDSKAQSPRLRIPLSSLDIIVEGDSYN